MAGKILVVTSCAVGVAHTYMAAENLEKAAESMGVDIKNRNSWIHWSGK